jgi:acyl transferase domain-containing protein/2-polyprenyl-3-methyl-5-hydroxy-6-metoxy-1,4-benzoquinol methylase
MRISTNRPSITVKTGCSAALVALHDACRAVISGDCESAVIGGANLILAPGMSSALTEQRVLSPEGSCKTFSADADGYARAEAINAIYIKPLSQAIRDGNPIRAIIRATATNSDGKTPGISVPNADAHERLMRHAYSRAGLKDLSETAFVECHGTGTPTGDPIEANAVGRVFGEFGVYIGAVKPNLGHSEGASGLTSLIKVVLALEHQTIPPNIKFVESNPKIAFNKYSLVVPTEAVPWPKERRERASINSFGIGGSNAHVVLDSARDHGVPDAPSQKSDTAHLLLYSAASEESLHRMIEGYQAFVRERPDCLVDLSYTLANRRERLPHRAFCVVSKDLTFTDAQVSKVGQAPQLVMVFSGQGAQWPAMGRDLLLNNPAFRQSIQNLDRCLQRAGDAPDWTIEQELLKNEHTSRVHTAEFALPLSTAVQIALVDSLRAVGVEPDAVVGHSSGEIAAAYAVGALDEYEAITVATARGFATTSQRRAGSMAAVGMGWTEVEEYLVPGVSVACENSPSSVTISGDTGKVLTVVQEIKTSHPGVLARHLKVDQAYHSHHMADVSEVYYDSIKAKVTSKRPTKPLFSALYGRLLDETEGTDPRYWQKNMESPVMFRSAVASLLQHPVGHNPVFLEIGPHSTLSGPLRQICTEANRVLTYIPTMVRGQNSLESFLTALGKLFQFDMPMDYQFLSPKGSCLPDLPRYPWSRGSHYWHESRLSEAWRHRQHPHHSLLGSRTLESSDLEPSWRNVLQLDDVSWIRDHKVQEDVVFPFAAYIAMSGEAARQITGIDDAFSVRHVLVNTAMVLAEARPSEILTTLRRHHLTDSQDSQWWDFTISSHNGNTWATHCRGQVRAHASCQAPVYPANDLPRAVQSGRWYRAMRKAGLNYGPSFQGLQNISAHPLKFEATAEAVPHMMEDNKEYHIHPTVIDFSLQLLIVAATKGLTRKLTHTLLPTSVQELTLSRCETVERLFASARPITGEKLLGRALCVNGDNIVLNITGLNMSLVDRLDEDAEVDSPSTARLHWGTHIDFMKPAGLFRRSVDRSEYGGLLDELVWLCLVQAQRCIRHVDTRHPHLRKYRDWTHARLLTGECPEHLRSGDTLVKVSQVVEMLSKTPARAAAAAMHKVLTQMNAIFAGEANPLDVLFSDGTLSHLYDFMDQFDYSAFLRRLAHSKPNLRVLEIGAGAGATTSNVLANLTAQDGSVAHTSYMFTDISPGFFPAAKKRFQGVPNMQFAVLDISKNPIDQGFTENEYDLVIATNVLHATESLGKTLRHVRKLLHPEGRLFLQELASESKWANFIFGLLPGWWLGEADGRNQEPYVSPGRWEAELLNSGFAGLDMIMLDSEEPYQLNAVMTARPHKETVVNKDIVILCQDKSAVPRKLLESLTGAGYLVSLSELADEPPCGTNVLAIVDETGPFFDSPTLSSYKYLQNWIASIGDATMMWLTKLSQMYCDDPSYAPILGVARSLRSELSMKLVTCEVESIDRSCETILAVLAKVLSQTGDDALKPDFEYAIFDNEVYVGRYHPFSIEQSLRVPPAGEKITSLKVGKKRGISSLHWASSSLLPLSDDSIEVTTKAFGLNFRVSTIKNDYHELR